jgi:hypothetical protein
LANSFYIAMCHLVWLLSRKYRTVWYHPASSKLWYLTSLSFVNFQEKLTGTSSLLFARAKPACSACCVFGARCTFCVNSGLAEALGEGRRADLPAEHEGRRGLRRRRAVLIAVVAPTPSRVVACRRSRIYLARTPSVDDVAGVAVQCPARVEEPFLGRRASRVGGSPRRFTRMDRGFTPLCGSVASRFPLLANA